MRNDEFNFVKITNEREGFSSFEFGNTQKEESTSFSDNKNNIRDEVNDNPTSNAENNLKADKKRKENKDQEDQLRDRLSESSSEGSGGSSSSGGASGASTGANAAAGSATAATVAGVSIVAVTTISTLVGINVFIQATCKFNNLNVGAESVAYNLDLTDTNNDKFIITLNGKNNDYYQYNDLNEGNNVGQFDGLTPNNDYHLAVLDETQNNFVIHEEDITTKNERTGFTVTFDTSGGSHIEPQVVQYGGYAIMPEDPTWNNHTFVGWYVDRESEKLFDFDTPITSDTVIYAGWIEGTYYTVSFNANGGSGDMETMFVKDGDKAIIPRCTFDAPSLAYMFDRWRLNSPQGSIIPVGYELTITNDICLYATWKEDTRFTVTFDSNGGSGKMSDLKVEGPLFNAPECTFEAPQQSLKFDHWVVEDEPAGNEYLPGEQIMITHNLTLMARWTPDVEFEFHINYVDTRNDDSANVINYTYTYVDPEESLMYFNLYLYPSEGMYALYDMYFEQGENITDNLEVGKEIFADDLIWTYLITAYVKNGNYYDIATGSIASKETQLRYLDSINIGDINIANGSSDVEVGFIRYGESAYIPFGIDGRDLNNTYNAAIYYSYGDGTYGSGYNWFNGMLAFGLSDAPSTDTIDLDYFEISNSSGTLFRTSNLHCTLLDEYKFYGFYFWNSFSSKTFRIRMVGSNPKGSVSFDDMACHGYQLIFKPKNRDGYLYDKGNQVLIYAPFSVDYVTDKSMLNPVGITFEDSEYEKLLKYKNRYIFDVELSYYNEATESTESVTSYYNFSLTDLG